MCIRDRLRKDLKKHIDDISRKYIIKGETAEHAILFVPAEAIFAHIHGLEPEIVEYAISKRVWITGPMTLMAISSALQLAHRDLERSKHAKIIQENLVGLGSEFKRYEARWQKLSKNLDTVHKSAKELETTTGKITSKFNQIQNAEVLKLTARNNVEVSS